ncbi:MAG TPA: type II and III secretion system protein [Bryobacteraceae bacterium]
MYSKLLILLILAVVCRAVDPAAAQLYQEGLRAERAGDRLHALLLYSQALALDPADGEILARKNALQAATVGSAAAPAAPVARLSLDSSGSERQAVPPLTLKPLPGTKTFNVQGASDKVITQVAQEFGIQTVFETGYQPLPSVTFRTGEMSLEEAFRSLEATTNSLLIPIAEKLVLVGRDTPQRRSESSPVMEAGIPIPERLSTQEAQELIQGVQQALELKRVQVDPLRRLVLVRDVESKVIAARQLFSDLSRPRAQVEIEVELLTVTKNSSLAIGLSLPTTSPVVNFGNFLNSVPSAGGFTKFLAFGAGKTLFGFGIADAAAFATLSRASAQTVLTAQMFSADGMPAQMHIGDHYPIANVGYFGSTSGEKGQVFTPPPSVTFEDLGLVLKVTPTVHEQGEVTLDIDAEFKVLGTGGANGIPDVQQRKLQSKVRLAPGEWAVVAGLTQDSVGVASNGIAGLAEIPLLGRLFRTDTRDKLNDQTLLVLKPHIVISPPWEEPSMTLWTGTDGKPLSLY